MQFFIIMKEWEPEQEDQGIKTEYELIIKNRALLGVCE